ncbi:hypothetical protein OROHE_005411 [Orobanche hederae]
MILIIVQLYMATFSGLILNFSGADHAKIFKSLPIGADHAKMPFPSNNHDTFSFSKSHCNSKSPFPVFSPRMFPHNKKFIFTKKLSTGLQGRHSYRAILVKLH